MQKTAALTLFSAFIFAAAAHSADDAITKNDPRRALPRAAAATPPRSATLPPKPALPEGVEELRFADFFKLPVGPAGLELTARIKHLDGRRVRIGGFMVFEEVTRCTGEAPRDAKGRPIPAWLECLTPGRVLLTPTPQAVSYAHYGVGDDLPPQTLFVTVPEKMGEPIPHARGPLLLTGVLSVGNKTEPDGRISAVRLRLDPATPSAALSFAETKTQPNPTTRTNP